MGRRLLVRVLLDVVGLRGRAVAVLRRTPVLLRGRGVRVVRRRDGLAPRLLNGEGRALLKLTGQLNTKPKDRGRPKPDPLQYVTSICQ